MNTIADIIPIARGDQPADLLLKNARVVNVYCGSIMQKHIAIAGGRIVGFGEYNAKEIVDLNGKYVSPGFVDAHVHIESSMACVSEFIRSILPLGTTTIIADPHEIANVLGVKGIEYMLQSAENQPMNVYFGLPSCVPATDMETSGAKLQASDLVPFLSNHKIVGLGELMNFPGVIYGDNSVLEKITHTLCYEKRIDGHAPGLTGKNLNTYIGSGITSDHECTTVEEATEKLESGMYIFIREGTGAKNLEALLPIVSPANFRRIMWCTDDRHPHDLLQEGHIDSMIRKAIRLGLDPIMAIQMATLNPTDYFNIRDIGGIGPGKKADLVVFSDLHHPVAEKVYFSGNLVAEHGKLLPHIQLPKPIPVPSAMNLHSESLDFSIPITGQSIHVIEVVPNQIITRKAMMPPTISNQFAVADPTRDLLKIAVIERYTGLGNMGKGFVKGFGLQHGALASSVAHDSHNIIVVGTNDIDMRAAVDAVVKSSGGLVAACHGNVLAHLPLPIAGLMSDMNVSDIQKHLEQLIKISHDLGCIIPDPFMILSFLALPVIPELKLTDKGLVDVNEFKVIQLFAD